MYKQTITFEDFDENEVTETLYFNLTKTDVLMNLSLQDDLQKLQDDLGSLERDFTTEEKQRILDMVKRFMKLSYGVRSADGKKHTKNDEVWADFESTAAYDAYLMSLFESEEGAMTFLLNVLPKNLREEVEKELPVRSVEDVDLPEDKNPKDMSQEELLEAYRKKSQES